jgi:hypothetical protein
MAILSLRAAAQEAGTSKSTILRATQSGRLSAPSTGDGGYAIDSAELFRVYPPKAKDVVAEHSACRAAAQVARREALYSSAMADWRRQRDAGAIIELQKNCVVGPPSGEQWRVLMDAVAALWRRAAG